MPSCPTQGVFVYEPVSVKVTVHEHDRHVSGVSGAQFLVLVDVDASPADALVGADPLDDLLRRIAQVTTCASQQDHASG